MKETLSESEKAELIAIAMSEYKEYLASKKAKEAVESPEEETANK